jgi:DNA-binding phage protein
MKNDFLFKNLVVALNNRIPQRGKLVDVLTELLGIEKEAVYRRLRGSVPFSFQEVHAIAVHMGLSLDNIAENISLFNRQMSVLSIEFLDPKEKDFERLEIFRENIKRFKEDPSSESGAITTAIPLSLHFYYNYIHKFYFFKWSHQFGNPQKIKTYAETNPAKRLNLINREYVENLRNSPQTVYIFDRQFIESFMNEIHFFFDIRLITKEDVLCLKEDLHLLINDLERYAVNGCFDTGNKVKIFLANVLIDANYYYVDSATYKMTVMRSFAFNDSYSFDEVIFQNMKNWLNFLKRTSTLISEGSAVERIQFFEKQRKLVDSM